jgi:hypothetical protein
MIDARRTCRAALLSSFCTLACLLPVSPVHAQVGLANSGPFDQREIQTVTVRITNPSPDAAFNQRIEDAVRRGIRLFPGQRFSEQAITLALGQVQRRNPQIASATYEPFPSVMGGVDVTVTVTLGDGVQPAEGRGMAATGNAGDFPLILDRNGTILRFRLDLLGLYYGNNNAWYGQPDQMLAGNPLVQGTPAGEGWSDWVEGYVHYGIYGITPLTENLYAYGSFSAITSASTGQELFTDETRDYTYWEDAYVGLVGGNVDSAGQPAHLQPRCRTAALHAGERLPHRQHGVERLGPRGAPGERALGLRPARAGRGRVEPDEGPGLLGRPRRAPDPRHRNEDRRPQRRELPLGRADGRRVLADGPGVDADLLLPHGHRRRHARRAAARRRALQLDGQSAGRARAVLRGRGRAPDQRQLRHGRPRGLGRGGLQLRQLALDAHRQLPALLLLGRRSRHRDLRTLGPAPVGRHGRAVGAGREPLQGRAGFERHRPPPPGALPAHAEGRARPQLWAFYADSETTSAATRR